MNIQKETDFKNIEKFLRNNFSSPTHWPDWNIAVSEHFSTDFYYFTAYEDGKLIGNNVWIGCRTLILKGTEIGNNVIIGAKTFLNKKYNIDNVLIAGQKAKIVKSNILW